MKEDIEKIWAQIDADFEADDAQDVTEYLIKKGWNKGVENGVADLAESIVEQAFIEQDTLKVSPSEKYRIIKQLDFGGQSDIYLAERSDGIYHKTVIIKFISQLHHHAGAKQQFLQEMQMLADLNHPGVVGILDGGLTDQGQPWLVLDYIEGEHIDDYCLKQAASNQDIIKLIIDLCDALRFVHRRQVLHLDIKPSNVLIKRINQVPHPVLIDFGIAKKQQEQDDAAYGTPGYAAPETLKSESPPDIRADVFALGMLLAQLICRNDVSNVGLLSSQDRQELLSKHKASSDLQAIISQATQKDRNYRYQDTEAFRNDLNRYLLGMPLSMDSGLPQMIWKGVKRHKMLVTAASVAMIFAIYFAIQYTQEIRQLQRITLQEKQQSDELMNYMLDELFEELAKIGRVDVLKSVTEKSVNHLASQDPRAMTDLDHLQTAKAYMNAGQVFDALELSQQGKQAYLKAKENLKPLDSLPYAQVNKDNLLGEINIGLSQVLSSEGQEEATEKILTETIRITEGLQELGMLKNPLTLWEAYLQLGWHHLEYGKDRTAKDNIDAALMLSQAMLEDKNQNRAQWLYAHSHGLQLKAWYEIDFGTLDTGIQDLTNAVSFAQEAISSDPEDIKKLNNRRILLNQLGYFLLEKQAFDVALPYAEEAVKQGQQLQLKVPKNLEFKRELAVSYSTLGEVLQQLGNNESALNYYQASLNISELLATQDKNNYSTINDFAIDILLVANLNHQLGYQKEALNLWHKAADLMRPIQEKEPNNKYYNHTLFVALVQLKKYLEAKVLYQTLVDNGMDDQQIKDLLVQHQLSAWENNKKGPE